MKQLIIYQNPQADNVCVCVPTGEISIQEVLAKDCPAGASIVHHDSLPNQHNDFFNAWRLDGDSVVVHHGAATEITKDRLRAERAELFAELDVAYMKALESGDDVTEIVAEKQRLRDITLLADDCTTLEELRALKCAIEVSTQ